MGDAGPLWDRRAHQGVLQRGGKSFGETVRGDTAAQLPRRSMLVGRVLGDTVSGEEGAAPKVVAQMFAKFRAKIEWSLA